MAKMGVAQIFSFANARFFSTSNPTARHEQRTVPYMFFHSDKVVYANLDVPV